MTTTLPITVGVCPNAPLSMGTEIVEAVLESIPYDQMKNLHHSSIDYYPYCCNHMELASINQTEISGRGLCLGKMVGRAALQCHVSPVPADEGWNNVWEDYHVVTSRHLQSTCLAVSSRQYST
jgi:hypothetical protein